MASGAIPTRSSDTRVAADAASRTAPQAEVTRDADGPTPGSSTTHVQSHDATADDAVHPRGVPAGGDHPIGETPGGGGGGTGGGTTTPDPGGGTGTGGGTTTPD